MKRTLIILYALTAGLLSAGEPGSSPSNAWLIPTGSTGVTGTFVRDTDTHWYRFLAAPTLVYTVRVDNETLWDHDVALRIFADGEDVASANSAIHPEESSSLVWTNTGGVRSYYLEVSPFLQFTTGTYSVVVNANDTDTDGDGIPDAWETLYFGGPTNAVATETNAAGVSNWDAFVTGIDPNDPDGALRARMDRGADGMELRWNTVPYAAYRVESSTNILDSAGWVFRGRYVTGSLGGEMMHVDMTGPTLLQYYRIVYEVD